MRNLQMEMYTKENSNKAKPMGRVFINGKMAKYMMVSGSSESNKVTASGKAPMESHTLVNGLEVKLKDTEYMYGLMEIDTKESGKLA